MKSPEISFACPTCSREIAAGLDGGAECPECGRAAVLPIAPSLREGGPIERCPACDGRELYVQRDFNQKVGLVVVIIGACLAPFTHYLSLVVAAIVDALLYSLLPEVTVCYRCAAHFRGFPKNPAHKPYDLHTAEQYSSHSGSAD